MVLADPRVIDDPDRVAAAAAALGAHLLVVPVAATDVPGVHDTLRLAAAYRDVFA